MPKIRALCLASPAFDIKLYVPFCQPGLNVLSQLKGNFFINSYVKAKMLTHDEERAQSYGTDPKIARAISVRMLLGLYAASKRIVDDAQNIYVPTQVLEFRFRFCGASRNRNGTFIKNCRIRIKNSTS